MFTLNPNVVIIVFIIVICVAILAINDLTTSMLVMSLLANTLFIVSKLCKNMDSARGLPDFTSDNSPIPKAAIEPADNPTPLGPPELEAYGAEHAKWDSYKQHEIEARNTRSENAPRIGPGTYDVDDKSVDINFLRSRDKQTIESISVRDANYYKYHFANELDDAEKQQWWGNKEI